VNKKEFSVSSWRSNQGNNNGHFTQKLALKVTLVLVTSLYKIYQPTTKFSDHKYSGVKALQKSKNCKNSSFADNYTFDHKNAGV